MSGLKLTRVVTLTLRRDFRTLVRSLRRPSEIKISVSSLAFAGVLGYFLGSIPSAYLIVKWKSKVDIRFSGSGNVGTLNSLQVTKSKAVGATVLVLDILKGVLAVLVARQISGGNVQAEMVAGVAAVCGHNFPVWLGFRGGRGLATAAGAMFVLSWQFVVLWGALWVLAFLIIRNVNVGNAVASAVTMAIVIAFPSAGGLSASEFPVRLFAVVLLGLILIKLITPVKEFILARKRV